MNIKLVYSLCNNFKLFLINPELSFILCNREQTVPDQGNPYYCNLHGDQYFQDKMLHGYATFKMYFEAAGEKKSWPAVPFKP